MLASEMIQLTIVLLSLFLASCSANSNPLLNRMHPHAMTLQSSQQTGSYRVKRQSTTIECAKISEEYQCTSGYTQGQIMEALMCRNESAARLMAQRCAKNEQGEYCSVAGLVTSPSVWSMAINSCGSTGISCFNECRNSLELLKNTLGCCLNYALTENNNIIDIRGNLPNSLWQKCNVTIPSACTNRIVPQPPSNAQICTPEEYSH